MEVKNLPIPNGPYQIGTAQYDLVDSARKEVEYPLGRLVPVRIYFPLQIGAHILGDKVFEDRAAGDWPLLDVKVYSRHAELSSLDRRTNHPIVLLNHGDTVAMTDYGFIAEDLASHGYVVIAIQHQLKGDPQEPSFWEERSISRYGRVIENILFVFEWLKENQITLFHDQIDLKKIALIGHSMGGNALLLLANRTFNTFKERCATLLPHADPTGVKEAMVLLDPGGFPYPTHNRYPLFFLMSEEREEYQGASGAYRDMMECGHKVNYYKGSKHISFMDHGWVNPPHPLNPSERYFNGTLEERMAFFNQVRRDIREFLNQHGIYSSPKGKSP
jgi:dienelactone hydrolase